MIYIVLNCVQALATTAEAGMAGTSLYGSPEGQKASLEHIRYTS